MQIKVLMVCLGNICRSPLAEGILKHKVDSRNVYVDSAGTAGYHIGKHPDSRSIDVAAKHGIAISNQRCRQFTISDFENFDYIYAMDKHNYTHIVRLAPNPSDRDKVKLLLSEVSETPDEVPDPYYGGADGFQLVFDLIDTACNRIAKKLEKQ